MGIGAKLKIRLLHGFFLLTRPMTLGVRIIVTDAHGRLLLVRHGYVKGWHLPGGGVEAGETAIDAARKELKEETGIEAVGALTLISVHANRRASRRDHVLLYRCQEWRQAKAFAANREIRETRFFGLGELPAETTEPTVARIEEVFAGRRPDVYW